MQFDQWSLLVAVSALVAAILSIPALQAPLLLIFSWFKKDAQRDVVDSTQPAPWYYEALSSHRERERAEAKRQLLDWYTGLNVGDEDAERYAECSTRQVVKNAYEHLRDLACQPDFALPSDLEDVVRRAVRAEILSIKRRDSAHGGIAWMADG
ncbi:hypothetical protein Val02_68880 [Virgisporangium aliadipatigenens]|uniref:Uncharacterized protein n=1 Tax=Virgisporangium aliadipatigenens TaxID=741659 RepID=A0A8J3YT53_9ACTN|nr:hypothetical protein [Virgisporangium aliadipatigenens]GIJ50002.1 hypothetical protein Val02_68880 [Virgisporangium aliadipatigenens]